MLLNLKDQKIKLLPEGAFYWEEEKLLGFSDVHLGKADHFQKYGIAIPTQTHLTDLNKMSELIQKFKPQSIFILGDLVHSSQSWQGGLAGQLRGFFDFHATLDWHLILGNHERGSLEHLNSLPLILHQNNFDLGPFTFVHGHDDQNSNDRFAIAGHVHPVVELRRGPTKLRLRCFVESREQLLLPAFGEFTGGYAMKFKSTDQVYAIAGADVFKIPT